MATKAANKRLMKEYASIQDSPPPFIQAKPLDKNILEWHYIITGPPDSPYFGGEYHGTLFFVAESWNPGWSVATILTGLLSFMLENTSTTGSMATDDLEKVALAKESKFWNRKNNVKFREVFPELASLPATTHIEQTTVSQVSKSLHTTSTEPVAKTIPDQDDIIAQEVRYLLSSDMLKILAVGLVVAVVAYFAKR